jgi:hypothetical protein
MAISDFEKRLRSRVGVPEDEEDYTDYEETDLETRLLNRVTANKDKKPLEPLYPPEEKKPSMMRKVFDAIKYRFSDQGVDESQDFVKGVGRSIKENVKELVPGISSALESSRDIRKMEKSESEMNESRKAFIRELDKRGLEIGSRERREALLEFDRNQGDLPNYLVERNKRIAEEDYAKRVGGTFFDVASLPFGGVSLAKTGVKGGLSGIMRLLATRAAEGAAFTGTRAATQAIEGGISGDELKDIGIQTGIGAGAGALLGGAEGGIKRIAEARIARKLAEEADNLADPFITKEGTQIITPSEAPGTTVATPDGQSVDIASMPTVVEPTKPQVNVIDEAVNEQAAAREAELAAVDVKPEPKPAQRLRQALIEASEDQQVRYETAATQRELAADIFEGELDNLKRLINAEKRRKTGLDATKIRGIDVATEMLRERTGRADLTVNDAVDYISAVPTKAEISKLKPAQITEVDQPPKEVKKTPRVPVVASEPVGLGEEKSSRAFQRVKETLLLNEDDPTYRTVNLENDAKKAVEIAATKFDDAVEIVLGRKPLRKDVTYNALASATANEAAERGNWGLQAQIERKRSLALTRGGQEISSNRKIGAESPSAMIDDLIKERMQKAKERANGRSITKSLDSEVTGIQKELAKSSPKLAELSNFINSLRC